MEDNIHTPEEKVALIKEWSNFFMEQTTGWFPDIAGALGAELAYLFAAIANDGGCDFQDHDEIIQILINANIGADASIWDFITIVNPNE